MDSHGNAIVVWVQNSSDDQSIFDTFARGFTAGVWGTVDLIGNGYDDDTDPQIAMDDNGNAVAIRAQAGSIYADQHSLGTWGAVKLLETGTKDAFVPQVAMDGSGNALTVW